MKAFFVSSLAAAFLVAAVPSARAQDAEVEGLKKDIEALRQEVEDIKGREGGEKPSKGVTKDDLDGVRLRMETFYDQWQRTLERNTAQTARNLTFNGTLQTRFTQTDDKTAQSGFGLGFLLLTFSGNLRKDYAEGKNLNYVVSLAADTSSSPAIPGGGASSGYPLKPLDVYLVYNIKNTLDQESSLLSAALGQIKTGFGLEPQTTDEFKPTINLAQFDQNLGAGLRDTGFLIKGDLFPSVDYGFAAYRVPFIEYSLGIFNGTHVGSYANANAASSAKDLVARLVLHAPVDYNHPLRGLQAGVSSWTGEEPSTTNPGTLAWRRRVGADISFVNTPVGFSAEWAQSQDDPGATSVAVANVKGVTATGYIITLDYNFGQQYLKDKAENRYDDWYPLTYQPFIQYDSWDPGTGNNPGANVRTVTTLGFNWFFASTTKLQFNYNSIFDKGSANNSVINQFLTQFQFGF